jgi:hypothetical protein
VDWLLNSEEDRQIEPKWNLMVMEKFISHPSLAESLEIGGLLSNVPAIPGCASGTLYVPSKLDTAGILLCSL